jgi:hypothetical protein
MRSGLLVACSAAVALAGIAAFADEGGKSAVKKGDRNQGQSGLLISARIEEKFPDRSVDWDKFTKKVIDFGTDTDPRRCKIYKIFITYAVPSNPNAKADNEKGWTPQEPQHAAILKPTVLSEKQVRGAQSSGFYVGLYRAKKDDAAVKTARKLAENCKILKIEVKEVERHPETGRFEYDEVFEDPSPVLIDEGKVGWIHPDPTDEYFMFAKPQGPDSAEGKEANDKEASETGVKKSQNRKYRCHLEIRKEMKRRPDGTWGAPGEGEAEKSERGDGGPGTKSGDSSGGK